jgi:DNA polymerase I-like protein with 3'-5' exonuclease and polymerase domains
LLRRDEMTKTLVLDIETNSAWDTIWCCVSRDIHTGEVVCHTKPETLKTLISKYDIFVGHNLLAFDCYHLNRLWKTGIRQIQVQDTLVMSRLLNPSIEDGHSLAAWGNRLGFFKSEFNDWDGGLTDEMISYCIQDTLITQKLYEHLTYELKTQEFSTQSQELEHEVQAIIAIQERNGFKIDEAASMLLLSELKARLDIILVEMQGIFPPRVTSGRTHKTSGKPLKDIIEPFNPASRQQIAERLQEKGWKPKKRTEKGSVIVDEATLETLDFPEAKALAEYLMLQKRIAQVESWIESIKEDGRVHGRVITNGAVTGRMTHMSPNMAQVPNSGAIYGSECRALWTTEKGNKLVGIDASGLELRMLAHYMNDHEYTNEVVSGDIHTANQTAAGLQTRNQAKTFIYAFLYGAGSTKIGTIVGGSAKEGQQLIDNFLQNTPKLAALRKRVSDAFSKRGRLQGLDGRKLLVRSEHSALNTLLQGAGAIVMKKAVVILFKDLTKRKIPFKLVANVHDEWQIEVPEQYAVEVGQSGVRAIEVAGREFKMNCPLTGEYKVGNNWKETH